MDAKCLLDVIARTPPTSPSMGDKLAKFAFSALCKRWHSRPSHSQVDRIVRGWQAAIQNQYHSGIETATTISSERAFSRAMPAPLPTAASTAPSPSQDRLPYSTRAAQAPLSTRPILVPSSRRNSPLPPHGATSSSQAETLSRASGSSPQSPIAVDSDDESPIRTTPPRPSTARIQSTSPPTTEAPPLGPLPPAPSRSPTRATPPPPPPTAPHTPPRTQHSAHPPTTHESSTPAAPSTPPPTALTSPPPAPCPHPHPHPHISARRKPITSDNCGICTEPICCVDDAVWCRAQCGQNVHRECFGAWRRRCAEARGLEDASLERRLAVVTCVYCRGKWRWEWED